MTMRILEDQKDLWLFPTQLAHGKHWVPTLVIAGVTGVLIATDPHDEPYFRNNKAFEETSEIFSTSNTGIVEVGVPFATYAIGLLRHDSYTQQERRCARQACMKHDPPGDHPVVGRASRPSQVAAGQDFRDTLLPHWRRKRFHQRNQFSFRSCHGRICNRDRYGSALWSAQMGSVGGIWSGGADQRFPHSGHGSFPFRRFPRSRTGVHHYAVRRIQRTKSLAPAARLPPISLGFAIRSMRFSLRQAKATA